MISWCHPAARSVSVGLLIFSFARAASFQPSRDSYFEEAVEKRYNVGAANVKWSLEKLCPVSTSVVATRVLREYGAMFVAHESVLLPQSCIQRGERDVIRYQQIVTKKNVEVGGLDIALQAAAADALNAAVAEAASRDLRISPLDGAIAAGRSYGDTLMLWNSRFFPAMNFWIKRGRLSETDRQEIARLDLEKKIEKVLEWESHGIYFSTDRTHSIFTSTAPPGASQHLALIAFDVLEFWQPEVRSILNRNGWYQTVVDDPAHFTYLGFSETELSGRGLRPVLRGSHRYWVPNLAPIAGLSEATN